MARHIRTNKARLYMPGLSEYLIVGHRMVVKREANIAIVQDKNTCIRHALAYRKRVNCAIMGTKAWCICKRLAKRCDNAVSLSKLMTARVKDETLEEDVSTGHTSLHNTSPKRQMYLLSSSTRSIPLVLSSRTRQGLEWENSTEYACLEFQGWWRRLRCFQRNLGGK